MTRQQEQQKYTNLASAASALVMRRYSSSFNLASHLLARQERQGVQAIYGFARLADELVDTFDRPDAKQLLQEFKQDTYKAIKHQISLNPILQSFAMTAVRYKIDVAMIGAFFSSMEADLTKSRYSQQEYDRYVYGSGEVVGLMCLKVFTADNSLMYRDLAIGAQNLGAAFQKVNFLRDFGSDYRERKRLYIPNITSIKQFSVAKKQQMEADIYNDFTQSRQSINELPLAAKVGVAIAYRYYLALFTEIQRLTPAQLYSRRLRLSRHRKLWLALITVVLQGVLGRKL